MWDVVLSVLLAASMWFVIFVVEPLDFWISMSIATAILMGISLFSGGRGFSSLKWSFRSVIYGVLLAFVLYGIFWVGNILLRSIEIIPDAGEYVASVYERPTFLPYWSIALLLLFPIGSGEELFWRGFVQRRLMERLGMWPGFLLTLLLYAGIHIPTGNPVLVLAALVAGGVWGLVYALVGDLPMVVVSHALWDVLSFVIFPFS